MSDSLIAFLIMFGYIFGGMFLCYIAACLLDTYYYPGHFERKRIAKADMKLVKTIERI